MTESDPLRALCARFKSATEAMGAKTRCAADLGVNKFSVYDCVKAGRIPAKHAAAVERWLAGRTVAAPTEAEVARGPEMGREIDEDGTVTRIFQDGSIEETPPAVDPEPGAGPRTTAPAVDPAAGAGPVALMAVAKALGFSVVNVWVPAGDQMINARAIVL